MTTPDPLAAAAVAHVVEHDDQIANLTRQLVAESIKATLHIIRHGTPEQKVQIARGFMPVLSKSLNAHDGEDSANEVHAKTREIMQMVFVVDDPNTEDVATEAESE